MTRIEVTLTGTTPTAKLYGALVSGMVGVQVAFSFDSDWDGLNKTAVFQGCCTKTRALVLTNETTVPYEVLQVGGYLEVGVEGRKEDGTLVYPSVMTRVGYIQTGADASADSGMEPSPTVYDDIMAEVNAIHQEGVKLAESEIDRIVGEYLTENPPAPGEPGADGEDGKDGVDGVSCTHEWNGTVLTVTSASGSSSADLKGDKGDPGEKGDTGAQGERGLQGDRGIQGEVGPQGPQGVPGEAGKDGAPGADGKDGTDGHTPQKGVDYYTEADKQEMVAAVLTAMPTWKGGSY